MTQYECRTCSYKTMREFNYSRHLKSKKHKRNHKNQGTLGTVRVPPKNSGPPPKNSGPPPKNSGPPPKSTGLLPKSCDPERLECQFCQRKFTRSDNLHRHKESRCPIAKSKVEQLEKTIEKLEASQSQIITNSNNTTNNNTTTNQYIIFNNNKYYMEDIYKMGPKMLTNTFFKANPSLHELTQYFVKNLKLEDIKQYHSICDMDVQSSKDKYIAIAFDAIIKQKLQEMMKEKKEDSVFCGNYILSNDGSHRRFLTKGVDRWDYWTLDIPTIDKMFWAVIDLHNKNYKPEFFSVPRRQKIIKFVKNQNDWECNKKDIIGTLNRTKSDKLLLDSCDVQADSTEANISEIKKSEPEFDPEAEYATICDGEIQYQYNIDTDEVFTKDANPSYVGIRVYDELCDGYYVDCD